MHHPHVCVVDLLLCMGIRFPLMTKMLFAWYKLLIPIGGSSRALVIMDCLKQDVVGGEKKAGWISLFFLNSRWQTQRGWKRNAGSINIFYCSSILTRTCFKTLFFTSETVRSMQFERIRLGENQCKTSLYCFKMKLKVMGTKQRERKKLEHFDDLPLQPFSHLQGELN